MIDDLDVLEIELLVGVLKKKSAEANFMCKKYKDKDSCERAEKILKLYEHIEQLVSKYKR